MDNQGFANAAVEAAKTIVSTADATVETDVLSVASQIGEYFETNVVSNLERHISLGYVYVTGYAPGGRKEVTRRTTVRELRRWTAKFTVSPQGEISLARTLWAEHNHRDVRLDFNPVPLDKEEGVILHQMEQGVLVYDSDDAYDTDLQAGLVELQWLQDLAAVRLGTKPRILCVAHVKSILEGVDEGKRVYINVGHTDRQLVFFQHLIKDGEEYEIRVESRYGSQHIDYGDWLGD